MNAITVWKFDTARFRVALELLDEDDLDLSWDDDGSIRDGLETGQYVAFTARVAVYLKDQSVDLADLALGVDYLGNCIYKTADEFYTSHRDADPFNRNCTAMRKARGDNVAIAHYFPDMVRQAVAAARKNLKQPRIYVRPNA